jgi:hypothetical protein
MLTLPPQVAHLTPLVGRPLPSAPMIPILRNMSLPAFNRTLVKQLAQSIKAGAPCDKTMVTQCYQAAQREAGAEPPSAQDELAQEFQTLCIAQDLEVLQKYRSQFDLLPLHEMEAALFRLLNPDVRVSSGQVN